MCPKETSAAGAALQKISSHPCWDAWDATASSSECIESPQSSRRGLRCRLSDVIIDPGSNYFGHWFMIGFVSLEAACPQHLQQGKLSNSVKPESISYAARILYGSFYVVESGKLRGAIRANRFARFARITRFARIRNSSDSGESA